MNKWVKALVILIVLFFLFVPLIIATKYIAITQLYHHFVTTLSNLTGINQYLINAGVVLLMVPLYFGIRMFFSLNRQRRLIGISLLAVFLILYNIGLYQLTKDVQFSFSDGRTMKWYALTPEGVKFYDRSGVEPGYGIQLKPVTPEVIRHLKLIEKVEFNPVDPEKAIWFNPTTGDPQIWYYQSAGGIFEFFNKPGYHPLTGETLKPVNKQIHLEWLEKRKKGELRYGGRIDNSELKQKPVKKDEAKQIKDSASTAPGERWKLCWKKPENYRGLSDTRSRCDTVNVRFSEQGFRLEVKEIGGSFSVNGERVEENSYQGRYKNSSGEEGDIFLEFSPDYKLAKGWQKEPGSQVEVYTWLTK